ncbi:hypothetical protein HYY69_02905 [Candidatus Woesearchaeota archaeon]|nr:hypothetical protein [Candidatus Woesearchaeota archaeon]
MKTLYQIVHEEGKDLSLADVILKSLGVIGYINKHIEAIYHVTIEELRSGKKIPYQDVKPLKQQLFEELKDAVENMNLSF